MAFCRYISGSIDEGGGIPSESREHRSLTHTALGETYAMATSVRILIIMWCYGIIFLGIATVVFVDDDNAWVLKLQLSLITSIFYPHV